MYIYILPEIPSQIHQEVQYHAGADVLDSANISRLRMLIGDLRVQRQRCGEQHVGALASTANNVAATILF